MSATGKLQNRRRCGVVTVTSEWRDIVHARPRKVQQQPMRQHQLRSLLQSLQPLLQEHLRSLLVVVAASAAAVQVPVTGAGLDAGGVAQSPAKSPASQALAAVVDAVDGAKTNLCVGLDSERDGRRFAGF